MSIARIQKLSRIASFCRAATTCASTCITGDYKFKRWPHRSRDLSERVRKNRKCDRRISPCHCTAFVAFHGCSRNRMHPNTRSRRARSSVLEIYLRFDESSSYPRYFLRKHKSPVPELFISVPLFSK